jgi:hypothetical protein
MHTDGGDHIFWKILTIVWEIQLNFLEKKNPKFLVACISTCDVEHESKLVAIKISNQNKINISLQTYKYYETTYI